VQVVIPLIGLAAKIVRHIFYPKCRYRFPFDMRPKH
jgi:hypothetical protein